MDFNRIPYSGEGFLASALCFNKVKTKNILDAYFIKTPKYQGLQRPWEVDNINEILSLKQIHFPVVLKPIASGSSLGIAMIKDKDHLRQKLKELKAKGQLIHYYLEEKIKGREITVGLCLHQHQRKMLPVVELRPKKEFYNFEAKYTPGMTDMVIPASLSKSLTIELRRIADKLFDIFEVRECVRIDFMIDEQEKPYLLEINTSPGMTETSDIPKMLQKSGISLEHYLVENLYRAKRRK